MDFKNTKSGLKWTLIVLLLFVLIIGTTIIGILIAQHFGWSEDVGRGLCILLLILWTPIVIGFITDLLE